MNPVRPTLCILFFCAVAAAQEQPPNVLFIVTDDCNCDLGCYGHPLVKTPNIDRLAKRGVRFTHAYSQYPVCNPSRSSFMTSLYPDQTGVLSNAGVFRKKHPNVVTMSQMFRNHGYFVGRVGKIYHYNVPDHIGTDGDDDPASWDTVVNPIGIDKSVEDRIRTLQEGKFGGTLSWLNLDSRAENHTDGIGARETIALMRQHHPARTKKPFFIACGFYRPHTPYVAPSRFFSMYPRDAIEPELEKPGDRDDIPMAAWHDRPKQRGLTMAQRKEIIQAYYASISLMDEQVGHLLDALDEMKLTDNTVVVFISDHGYHLGAHGLWQKSDLFEGSCRVPMIIAEPDSPLAGRTSHGPVELLDLYPTLAEICGLTAPRHVKGLSLAKVLADPTHQVREAALSVTVSRARQMHKEFTKKRVMGYSVRTRRYRYTQWGGGTYGHELYDYETDPNEYTNLADKPKHAATLKRMRALLEAAVARAK